MAAGLAVAAAGFGVLAGAGPAGGLTVPVLGATIFAAGIAPVGTLATDLVVGAAPVKRAGAAAAISETAAELGGSLGIAVLGSLGTAAFTLGFQLAALAAAATAALLTAVLLRRVPRADAES